MVRKVLRQSAPLLFKFKVLATFISWCVLIYILLSVRPQTWQDMRYAPLFFSIFVTTGLTVSIFTRKVIAYLLIPLGLVTIVAIRIYLIKDFLNPLLVLGLVTTLIYFFTSGSSDVILPSKGSLIHKSTSDVKGSYADIPQKNKREP